MKEMSKTTKTFLLNIETKLSSDKLEVLLYDIIPDCIDFLKDEETSIEIKENEENNVKQVKITTSMGLNYDTLDEELENNNLNFEFIEALD